MDVIMGDNSHQQLSSPTVSSISSSDLDTESTGSFFHEKTTTLGTLMGVRPRLLSPSASSTSASRSKGTEHHHHQQQANNTKGASPLGGAHTNHESRQRKGRTWWWRLCRDTSHHQHPGSLKAAAAGHSSHSLGDFLQVERRSIVDEYLGGGDAGVSGGLLFVDGRVVPPSQTSISAAHPSSLSSSSASRMPVFGICNSRG